MPRVIARLGDDVSTDLIYPGRFMATVLPAETPQHAFADDPRLSATLRDPSLAPGSLIVAGRNFGCGSSREQAASCLKGREVTIVARGFARIFLQNAINLGLHVVVAPLVEAEEGDEIDVTPSEIRNLTRGRNFEVTPLPAARQAIVDAGGLVAYTRRLLLQRDAAPGR